MAMNTKTHAACPSCASPVAWTEASVRVVARVVVTEDSVRAVPAPRLGPDLYLSGDVNCASCGHSYQGDLDRMEALGVFRRIEALAFEHDWDKHVRGLGCGCDGVGHFAPVDGPRDGDLPLSVSGE